MSSVDEAGPLVLRGELPAGAGTRFVHVFFLLLAAPLVYLFVRGSRSVALGVLAAVVVAGYVVALLALSRRPTAVEVREKGLVVFQGTRVETIDWSSVRGLELVVFGMAPTHVVLFRGRRKLPLGTGDRAQDLARAIARTGGLRWLHEPFSAHRD